uniref:receptor protein kinase CLAVATA1-like n=1 Tax=Erigeron canadensis TaxID=72917 RepID=UPI001CB965E5|nr:receptor protein kinase CLAVATA1-like [Erigeron canadensis]
MKIISVVAFCIIIITFLLEFSNGYSDLDALLKLKASMVLTPTGSGLYDWKAPAKRNSSRVSNLHCSFSGVSCDENSRVTSLIISNTPLFGTIPKEIGNLNKLVNLTLVFNNLTGAFPLEMSNLTRIRFINLSSNSFTGELPGVVIAGMTKLKAFDVYNNNFKGKLPVEFAKLRNLKTFLLGGNFFHGEIPEEYSEFPKLQRLGLQRNDLSGRIPGSLSKISTLKELKLGRFNRYQGGIPQEFGSFKRLELLDLAFCNLSGEIPESLGNLERLHVLYLFRNNFSGDIPQSLSGLVSLKELDFSENQLTGGIPESLSELKNLTLLNLFDNHLEGLLPPFIGDLPNLEVLQLFDNSFTSSVLPKNLGRNGKLRVLDVSQNCLTGMIGQDLCKGGNLQELILMENSFFGPLPAQLGSCKSLTKIRINNNYFNGSIPIGIFSLPELYMLDLRNNDFSGELPAEKYGPSLEVISISNNSVTGNIPSGISGSVNLRILSLELNNFVGELPKEIFNLKSLYKIDLSGNNLTGIIPDSIGNCSGLTSVDFSRNNIYGEIPKDFQKLASLSNLNLSRNRLMGEIPSILGHINSLTALDLSYNKLSGIVPSEGLLQVFNDTILTGNPNLTLPDAVHGPHRSKDHKRHSIIKSKLLIILSTVVLFTILICFGALVSIMCIKKRHTRTLGNDISETWKLTTFQKLGFEVEDIVECLKEENVIGRGGAGTVYHGLMPNGVDIAIKCLNSREYGFDAEIQTLGRYKHKNIVRLLGFVTKGEINLLIFEYMSNGSLGDILHGPGGEYLQWEIRYKIAVDVAKGLCYLHHDCSPMIIHRDVKSNNILLDSDFEAHVADFGLAKFLRRSGTSEYMSCIAGSFGYIAPEYVHTLKVDEKSDVYSFGVVLLVLISGKKAVGEFGDGVEIVRWVRDTISKIPHPTDSSVVLSLLDSRLSGYNLSSVADVLKISMMCVRYESTTRPSMREVVYMLRDNPPLEATLVA